MKIVKGSSFATWTKKLQGRSIGKSKEKSTSQLSAKRDGEFAVASSRSSRAMNFSEERGESESHKTDAGKDEDQREGIIIFQGRDDVQGTIVDTSLSKDPSRGIVMNWESTDQRRTPPPYYADVSTDQEKYRRETVAPVLSKYLAREAAKVSFVVYNDMHSLNSVRLESEINQKLTKESDHLGHHDSETPPAQNSMLEDPRSADRKNEDRRNSDTILLSPRASTHATSAASVLSRLESFAEPFPSGNINNDSTSSGSGSLFDNYGTIASKKDDKKRSSEVPNGDPDSDSGAHDLTGKHENLEGHADAAKKSPDNVAAEDLIEVHTAGNGCTRNGRKLTHESVQNQEQHTIIGKNSKLQIFGADTREAGAAEGDSKFGKSSEATCEELAPSRTCHNSVEKQFMMVTPSREEGPEWESAGLFKERNACEDENDLPAPSDSKCGSDSGDWDQDTKDKEDTGDASGNSLFKSPEAESSDNRAKSPIVPTRCSSKPKLESWEGLKRLSKNQRDTCIQDMDHDTNFPSATPPASDHMANIKEDSNCHSLATTMKNRLRQEKRTLGRLKLKSKRLKNSLVGVGELISVSACPSLYRLPISPASTASYRDHISPKSWQGGTMSYQSDTKMSDMIWWSNDRQWVEIIAVKSNEFPSAWDKEQGNKECENRELDGTKEVEKNLDIDDIVIDRQTGMGYDGFVEKHSALSQSHSLRASKLKGRSKKRDGRGSRKPESKNDKLKYEESDVVQRRERLLETRKTARMNRRRIALASISSDHSDVVEQCACNEKVIQDSRVLCSDGSGEDDGCRDIRYDLREMAKELLRRGPSVIVHWLD